MAHTAQVMGSPIVLAYSGGLDTSFLVPWLAEHERRPVLTVTVMTGRCSCSASHDTRKEVSSPPE